MKILVACEESQAVTKELRALGHEAYSCDIIECSGGHPEWHIKGDVMPLLYPKKWFGESFGKGLDVTHVLESGDTFKIPRRWDMIIAFPPCTHLAVSGARHFKEKIADGRQQQGIDFFMMIANADCDKIAIENPVGIMSTKWRKPDQYIEPWQHGHSVTKKTGLWLKGLANIKATNIVDKGNIITFPSGKTMHEFYVNTAGNSKFRSKTFPGIAKAMAEQWTV